MAVLTDEQIEERLKEVPEWRLGDGSSIERELSLADFAAALEYVNSVGELAEEANHHPDIFLHGWNKVRLTLSTHSAGGLTDADFEMASRIDGLD